MEDVISKMILKNLLYFSEEEALFGKKLWRQGDTDMQVESGGKGRRDGSNNREGLAWRGEDSQSDCPLCLQITCATVPTYYAAKPQPRERAWRPKKNKSHVPE